MALGEHKWLSIVSQFCGIHRLLIKISLRGFQVYAKYHTAQIGIPSNKEWTDSITTIVECSGFLVLCLPKNARMRGGQILLVGSRNENHRVI